jgi:GDPmannose 4,6-dehydratase
MLQQPEPKDYVIGTGESHSVAEFATLALAELQKQSCNGDFSGPIEKYIEVDPRLVRTNEIHDLQADSRLAQKDLGWKPEVDFRGLVKLMIQGDLSAAER